MWVSTVCWCFRIFFFYVFFKTLFDLQFHLNSGVTPFNIEGAMHECTAIQKKKHQKLLLSIPYCKNKLILLHTLTFDVSREVINEQPKLLGLRTFQTHFGKNTKHVTKY